MPIPHDETQRLSQIELHSNQVVVDAQSFVSCLRNYPHEPASAVDGGWDSIGQTGPNPYLTGPEGASQARRSTLTNLGQLQTLLEQPTDFLQRLTRQNQLLSCLRWLIEYQVLACIPLQGSVPITEVAALTDAPEKRLVQVVRMTATSGFLCEPQPGILAHTPLSAPFVSDLNLLDATLFLTETAAPAAFGMASATRRWGLTEDVNQTAYNAAFDTSFTFSSACEKRSRLRRQWYAYLLCGMGDVEAGMKDVLAQLNWAGLGNATVVDTAATSPAMAITLAKLYPSLRLIVQTANKPETNNGLVAGVTTIATEQRAPGTPQHVRDAALFIIRMPPQLAKATTRIREELHAHIGALSYNRRARLLLVLPSVLNERNGTDESEASVDAEALARLRDLTLWQLTNESELELSTVLDLVRGVHDGTGRLVVVTKFTARHHPAVALEMRYQSYAEAETQTTRI
ncbi:hypothetical protein GGS20DRAFT_579836 [Poronia punctata]|nr:hypothetical protein GGS20DRAFT_579836 [Poronia punctata]